MGFSLTVHEGKDLGRQFSFDQQEVTIGRTAENDVVLVEPGVSRRHAMIRFEGGCYVVQDLGSANGTQVNGSPAADEELQSGDMIAVGPVVFAFEAAQEDGSTRILDTSALPPPKRPSRPVEADGGESRRKTTALATRRPASLAAPVQEKSALAPSPRKRPAPIARAPAKGPAALSASERARILRENSGPLGKIKLFLAEKPPSVRKGIIGGAGALAAVVALLIGIALWPNSGPIILGPGDESTVVRSLAESQGDAVFGFGEDLEVTVVTRYELHFEFEHSGSIPVVYNLVFQSKGIERADEVDITLNAVPIGKVAPAMGEYSKEQSIRLPKKHLRAGTTNEIVFDNTFNSKTAGNETWAISSVELKMVPLPGCNPEGECEREARKLYEMAEKMWQAKQVSARNAYDAWDNLTRAALFLEVLEVKPDLSNLVQQTSREIERYLEGICSKTLLESKRAEELGNYEKALKALKDGLLWFPGNDHRCKGQLEEKIAEYSG